MTSTGKIAVAGATGRVGRHVVEILEDRGHDVVAMSRSTGVDLISGDGLADALAGAEVIVDAATGPSPDQEAATSFFTTATRNLLAAGTRAGVERIVVVSIVGTDRHTTGYGAAKIAHEKAMLAGPIPVHVLRATQFHEFVPQLLEWADRGDHAELPRMRTQLVAARSVASVLADLATGDGFVAGRISEVAGPREENLAEMARLLIARRGDTLPVEETSDPRDPASAIYENGGQLPGPDAMLTGPTFEEWLGVEVPA